MKKIGIIGSGGVATTLGSGFIKHGYDVMLGTRDASKLAEWKEKSKGQVGSFSDAAKFGEIIVLATKGMGAESALQLAGSDNLKGKTILDATNPIDEAVPPESGVLKFFTAGGDSLLERLQKAHPAANLVKCFSCVGSPFMVDPDFGGEKPTMFICGNNDSAKKEATGILTKFGWDTADMGTAKSAGSIESLCILWCVPGLLNGKWTHAFKLLRK